LFEREVNMNIQNVTVIGNGIVQTFASKGYNVLMVDVKQEFVARGLKAIEGSLDRLLKKEKITADDRKNILGRIKTSTVVEEAAGTDFVVEAVFESFDVKKDVFTRLDACCRSEVILSSNTSSISITKIAAITKRPDKFIGMHFMNPVPLMQLVEVIKGIATSEETCRTVAELCKSLGKTPVEANDYPGFVANRILLPMINEACFALMEGVATKEAIDEIMKLGMNHPMGPLALADLIGLDVCLAILNVLHEGLGDDKYRPCPLLKKMVDAGYLGRKSGRGFYQY
jgi:3-hydroxybutyryl-CoA dehydrogenase